MTWFKKFVIVLSVMAAVAALHLGAVAQAETVQRAHGIILLIGDGMGINQLRAAGLYAEDVLGRTLAIDSIRTLGITTTYSANSKVTDSAAASSALYSGYKFNNGVINILPDGRKVFTIAQAAKKAGLSVGIVSTTRLTDATPAALYSHSRTRKAENSIAEQLPKLAPDVALAGGLRHFIPQDRKGSKRKDDTNLIESMKSKGYAYVTNIEELKAIDPATSDKLFGLFAMSNMAYELDRQNVPSLASQPSLEDMTKVTLAILEKNPKGFFAMIEGGRIDHACHAHDIKASIYDTLAFDDAVRVALEYREKYPDVLVLVTADHETGGLGLGIGTTYALSLTELKPIKYSLQYLNHLIQRDRGDPAGLAAAAGLALNDDEKTLLARHAPDTKASSLAELKEYPNIDKYVFSWVHYALGNIQSDRAKLGWTSFAHTAQPVITYAVGPGQEEFSGFFDNTMFAPKMGKLLGLTLEQPTYGLRPNKPTCSLPFPRTR